MPVDDAPRTAGDAELVSDALAGSQDAFAAIYDRYADSIYSFCLSVLRNPDDAADAMQDTFVLAAQRLGQLREPAKLRAWLYAIARHESFRRAKARRRVVPTQDDALDRMAATPEATEPGAAMNARDAARIVWEVAEGLSERDRVLLELHLRQGLDGQELAAAIGVSPGHAYVLMNRLRDQVERGLGALLVARLGREECEALAAVLIGWDGRFSPMWRKRVARHVDDCEVCTSTRKRLTGPWSLLAAGATALVPAPAFLREQVLGRIRNTSARQPAGAWRRASARGGFPPPMFPKRGRRGGVGVLVAALLVAGGGGVLFIVGDDDRGRESVVAIDRSPSTVPATPSTPTTPPPSAGAAGSMPAVPVAPSVPTAPLVPAPTMTTQPDISGPVVNAGVTLPCVDFNHTPQVFSTFTSDPSGVKTVTALITVGVNTTKHAMSGNGSQWSLSIARAAPPLNVQKTTTVTWKVEAVDGKGNVISVSGPAFVVRVNPPC